MKEGDEASVGENSLEGVEEGIVAMDKGHGRRMRRHKMR